MFSAAFSLDTIELVFFFRIINIILSLRKLAIYFIIKIVFFFLRLQSSL